MSRAALADRVKVSENTIWRVESGRQEPGGVLLISMTEEIQGSFDDIMALVRQKNTTVEDGKRLAERRIKAMNGSIIHEGFSSYFVASREDVLEAISHALELQSDRTRMEKLLDFGKQLLEEKA